MNDEEILRHLMYGENNDDITAKKAKKLSEIKIIKNPKFIIIENDSSRHQVPTLQAFNILLKEYANQQNNLRKAQVDIKRLTETIKKLDLALKNIERELETKADIYD